MMRLRRAEVWNNPPALRLRGVNDHIYLAGVSSAINYDLVPYM
jgi:hypothetical protein